MKKWNTTVLLEHLSSDVRRTLLEAESLRSFSDARLNTKPADGGWSAA